MLDLLPDQLHVAQSPLGEKVFLYGPASCGKSTTGIARLNFLLQNNISGSQILVLTPQRTLQEGYKELLQDPQGNSGGDVTLATVGGLARRLCDLFWPLAAEKAGFANTNQPPRFLTLETSQYFMARIVQPLIQEQGYFDGITIDRNRLFSQVIDNLNKSAAVGFPYTDIGSRLDSAWIGDPSQRRVYQDVQECASQFRQYCLSHNLVDFSLQLEIFWGFLWSDSIVRSYLTHTYRHIIYDNVEEDIPRAHDLFREWLPDFDSALIIFDENAGYRRFLGADVDSAGDLQFLCDRQVSFTQSFVNSTLVAHLGTHLEQAINPGTTPSFGTKSPPSSSDPMVPLDILQAHFYPQLLDELVTSVQEKLIAGLLPGEIALLAPYLSDSLRFSLTTRLQERGIPWQTLRPSRSLREEPASHALLTLVALSHPQWNIHPASFDVAYAFMQSIENLDLVRAQLLTSILYHPKEISLASFDAIRSDVQERITFRVGNLYTQMRDWILAYRSSTPLPLDHFLRKLFGEVLSQSGFGFHAHLDSVRVAASLIESIRKFRLVISEWEGMELGQEYMELLERGVIASQYLESWHHSLADAVLVAPAYTFLMMNRPVSIQYWLDPGSSGWYQRLSQPLTHPYVLSRTWEKKQPGRTWSDSDEVEAGRHSLEILTTGLIRRCRHQVVLAISDLSESGFEQRGELLKSFQRVLQTMGSSNE